MDRGLQLCRQSTDIYHIQCVDQDNPSQLLGHQVSASPMIDRETGGRGSIVPLPGEHLHAHASVAPSNERRAESCVSLSLEGEGSDFVSPEISQQDHPSSMSRRLCYSDQPTPLLLPSQQQPGEDRGRGRCGSDDVDPNRRAATQQSEDCRNSATLPTTLQQNPVARRHPSSRLQVVYGREAFQRQSPKKGWSQSSNSSPVLLDASNHCSGIDVSGFNAVTMTGNADNSLLRCWSLSPASSNHHPQSPTQFFQRMANFDMEKVASMAVGTGYLPQDRARTTVDRPPRPCMPQVEHGKFMYSVHGLPPPFSSNRIRRNVLSHTTFDDSILPVGCRQASDMDRNNTDTGKADAHSLSTDLLESTTKSHSVHYGHSDFQPDKVSGVFSAPTEAEVELSRETDRSHNPFQRESRRENGERANQFLADDSIPQLDVIPARRSHLLNRIANEKDALLHGNFEIHQDPEFSLRNQGHSGRSSGSCFLWRADNSEHSELFDIPGGPGFHTSGHPTSWADLSTYSRIPAESFSQHNSSGHPTSWADLPTYSGIPAESCSQHNSSFEASDYRKTLVGTSSYQRPFGATLGHSQNQLETSDYRGFQVETSNYKSSRVESADYHKLFAEAANYHVPSADASDHRTSSVQPAVETSNCRIPSFESFAAGGYGGSEGQWCRPTEEDARKNITSSPVPRSSFSEDLAATTRRLLRGRSPPGYLYGGHHGYHRPRTLARRISIGLAQPLRREDSGSHGREHFVGWHGHGK